MRFLVEVPNEKQTVLHPSLRVHNIQNLNGSSRYISKRSRDTQIKDHKDEKATKNKVGKWNACRNVRCCGVEKEDELQRGEETALSLNYGVEKPQEIKPPDAQEEGNEAKIGPGSTWPTHTELLPRAKR